jgi:hypothetical protein
VGWSLGLALLGIAGLALTAGRLWSDLGFGQLAAGSALALVYLVTGMLTCFAILWVANQITGTVVSFPASAWPWRLLMIAGALLPLAILSSWARDRVTPWARFLGAWLLLGLLGLTLAVVAPLAANLLMVPVLFSVFVTCMVVFSVGARSAGMLLGVITLTMLPLTYILITIAYAMEETQGYHLAPAIYAYLVLAGLSLLPLNASPRVIAAVAGAIIVGWISVASLPLYSDWRPQHLSLYYVQDRDHDTAWLGTISANPIPDDVRSAMSADSQMPETASLLPWSSLEVPMTSLPSHDLAETSVEIERSGERVRVTLIDQGAGDFAQIILPADAGISDFHMAGRPAELWDRDGFLQARFFANGNQPLMFEFTTSAEEPVTGFLIDGSHTLPAPAHSISEARGNLAVPRHQGDQRLAFQRITF